MIHRTRKIIHIILGVVLVLVGLLGLVLPILNGTLLLIVGFILISFESPYVEKKLFEITKKNDTIHSWHLQLEKVLKNFFKKI